MDPYDKSLITLEVSLKITITIAADPIEKADLDKKNLQNSLFPACMSQRAIQPTLDFINRNILSPRK